MTKTKLALFIDAVSISALISLINYLWLNRIIKNAILVKIFSILIFLSSFVLILILFLKHNGNTILKNKTEKHLNSCLKYLITCDSISYSNFICKLLNCQHIENFFFKKASKIFYINSKTTLTDKDFISIQDYLYKNYSNLTCVILYRKKDKSFDEVFELSSVKFILFNIDALKNIMFQKGIYPIENNYTDKVSFKDKLKTTLKTKTAGVNRKHFKELFFSGISLLFLSLIVPFSNYYLIIGTILVTISIITLFKKHYTPKNSNDLNILIE